MGVGERVAAPQAMRPANRWMTRINHGTATGDAGGVVTSESTNTSPSSTDTGNSTALNSRGSGLCANRATASKPAVSTGGRAATAGE